MQTTSGGTTILFTDIEGSSRLWEQQPARMSRAIAAHDAAARAAVESNRGRIVKMLGDGLYAAFDDPLDGVRATVTLQRSLADPTVTDGLPLRVRCGLHRGPVERRDGDYFGPPVNRTARIMSAAHGGQVLLSQAVVDGLGARLPSDITLHDLGAVRLRDLSQPERVYQLVHPQLRIDFPALRSLEATPNNLPQQLTTFIGREREIAAARALLGRTRLLTLMGMGGLGKTRLSLQIAADELDNYADGVWFVDLAPIRDSSLVPGVTAQTLNVQEEPGRPTTQALASHLRELSVLIVLDNCEHVVGACADLANALLRSAPKLRIIATSREALRVPGEQTYAVMPLAAPNPTLPLQQLESCEAVQLFLDRARLHKPAYTLGADEAPGVAELCARLDGIPLAIELAAARMRTLSVAEINVRLRDRFKLLTGGGRVLLERQQTLRALVDWSYELLREDERALFDRLCVFAGGFDLAACENVCGVPPLAADDVLDLVASLVDKSLLMTESTGTGTRYRALETIRDYARERLVARGELAAVAARHCDHFLAMAKAANRAGGGPLQAEWTQRLEVELDNLRAGIALALEGGVDPVLSVKFEVALMSLWLLRGYATEGRKYVRRSLALAPVQASDIAHAHALYVGAALAHGQSDHAEAARMLEVCLALRRRIGNPTDIAATLSTLSLVRLSAGDADGARRTEEEALRIFRELGDQIGEAIGLLHLGQVLMHAGDDARARECLEGGLAIAREAGHTEVLCECERMLGEIALSAGDLAGARARFSRSLVQCGSAGDKRDEATSLWYVAKAELAAGERDAACRHLHEALRAFQAFEMTAEALGCIEDLVAGAPDAVDAVRLCGAVDAHRERLGLVRAPREERRWRAVLAALCERLGERALASGRAEGRDWSLEECVRRAQAVGAAPVTT